MKIKALVPWSNGKISMEQYEVLDLPDALAQNLIDAGIVVEIGGGSGGGVLVVTDTDGTLDKTWQEIYDADFAVVVQSVPAGKKKYAVTAVLRNRDNTEFLVNIIGGDPTSYTASSASGYPALS